MKKRLLALVSVVMVGAMVLGGCRSKAQEPAEAPAEEE